jgi:endonuclease/exonuclease/phosphatase family metal-dependent hydrolase
MNRRRLWASIPLTLALLAAETATALAAPVSDAPVPVTVMTRNMYVGADLDPLIGAPTAAAFVTAAAGAYQQVLASNVPDRAAAVAREIALTSPDVVALQEAYQWRTGPLGDPASATTVTVDALAALRSALTKLHLSYTTVVVQTLTDLEAPVPAPGVQSDLRMTDRNVLLVRSSVTATTPRQGRYAAILQFPSPVLGTVAIPDGWVSIDIVKGGRSARVVSTHLARSQAAIPATALIQRAQGAELLRQASAATIPVVLTGDLNSGPSAARSSNPPPMATYTDVLAAGWTDTWTATRALGAGYTWPLNNGDSRTISVPDQRIDHVFLRGEVTAVIAVRTGLLRSSSGVFASDHLGLVAYLRLR